MIGHRIERGARAAGVARLGRPILRPVTPVARVALGSDTADGALPPQEIKKGEEHVPGHDRGIINKVGHCGE